MRAIVTPADMRAADAAAVANGADREMLVERAGAAVARRAVRMMGGSYGRTVHVIAGPGTNGDDGRVAARRLRGQGVRVYVHEATSCPSVLASADLVIDAAFGTGLRDEWFAPDVGATPVLAVDVPSGVDGLTGEVRGGPLAVDHTVTFAAAKPGLLVGPGAAFAGTIEIADVGVDVEAYTTAWGVDAADVAEWYPRRAVDAHKWRAAVRVVAGSADMPGAARLCVESALRAGAGMVHASLPGVVAPPLPVEAVHRPLPASDWADAACHEIDRFDALAVGPGLGRRDDAAVSARELIRRAPCPVVVDGDGLFALAWNPEGAASWLRHRDVPTVITPHDGEYALLTGHRPGPDRLAAARSLAAQTGAVVVLKGPATVVADADGFTMVVSSGDARLATAGSGDVLTGVIAALIAGGLDALTAAAAGAWIHGRAGSRGPAAGLTAGDLPALVAATCADLVAGSA